MNKKYTVSICIATYNGENFIADQIHSVIKQLDSNDEIIISDDGSTDRTLEIVTALKDDRIKIFDNNAYRGPVGNFENALAHSKGQIIFLCDQDDIWLENKISSHLNKHENFDLVVSDAIVIEQNRNILFESFFNQRKSKKGLIGNLIRNSYIGCCMSFNRKVFNKALPFPKDIHMHDWWIGLVAELVGRVYFLEEPMMYYVRHTNNASDTLIKTLPFYEQLSNRLTLAKNLFLLKFSNKKPKN